MEMLARVDPAHQVSRNVLRKCGFKNTGLIPRGKTACHRGSEEIEVWEMLD